jgi:hypothetical protein
MNKQQAIKKRADWLAYCLSIGFTHDELPALEKVWDTYKDEYGNLRPSPSSTKEPVRKSLCESADPNCKICGGSGQDTTTTAYTSVCDCVNEPVRGSVEERWEKSVLIDALQKIRDMKLLKGETDSKYALNRTWHIAVNALNAIQSSPIVEEGKEAIEFAKWASKNYTFGGGYLWNSGNGEAYTTGQLYELFKSKNNGK